MYSWNYDVYDPGPLGSVFIMIVFIRLGHDRCKLYNYLVS